MPLTARAIAVLEQILINPNHGAAEGLSTYFGEGRDAIQTAINSLKAEGYLTLTHQKMANGRVVSALKITTTGYQALETRAHILLNRLNPNSNLLLDINTDLHIHKPNSEAEEKREKMDYEDAPMYIDPEDLDEFRRKKQKRKHEEKMEHHAKRASERMRIRDQRTPEKWTVTDSSFEFADQMNRLWHVAPWKVTNSRFRYALDVKRSEYNTDGAIERQMMELFFNKIRHDTKINDPEKIWRKFIVEFPSLLLQITRESATDEQLEEEFERSKKSRSKLRVQEQ